MRLVLNCLLLACLSGVACSKTTTVTYSEARQVNAVLLSMRYTPEVGAGVFVAGSTTPPNYPSQYFVEVEWNKNKFSFETTESTYNLLQGRVNKYVSLWYREKFCSQDEGPSLSCGYEFLGVTR